MGRLATPMYDLGNSRSKMNVIRLDSLPGELFLLFPFHSNVFALSRVQLRLQRGQVHIVHPFGKLRFAVRKHGIPREHAPQLDSADKLAEHVRIVSPGALDFSVLHRENAILRVE